LNNNGNWFVNVGSNRVNSGSVIRGSWSEIVGSTYPLALSVTAFSQGKLVQGRNWLFLFVDADGEIVTVPAFPGEVLVLGQNGLASATLVALAAPYNGRVLSASADAAVFLVIVTYWPGLTLFLPRALGMIG
jgi:hypothetical protein